MNSFDSERDESVYRVVRFAGPVREDWKKEIASIGALPVMPAGGFAIVYEIPREAISAVEKKEFVKSVSIIRKEDKIARWLKPFAGEKTINVSVFPGSDARSVAAAAGRFGVNVVRIESGVFQAEAEFSELAALASIPEVRFIDEARRIEMRNSTASWMAQGGFSGYRPVYDMGLLGENQLAGISDSGIDYDHEAFRDVAAAVQLSNASNPNPPDFTHRKIVNYWVASFGDNTDRTGHGTHVSCTVAGNNDIGNSSGNLSGRGIAPNAKITFTDLRGSYWPAPTAANMPEYFLGGLLDNCHAHNCSWGEVDPPPGEYTETSAAIDNIAYINKEMLIVVAQGNFGTCDAPATAKNVLSVSGSGACADGRLKPDVESPETIVSASSDCNPLTNNSGYKVLSGSSMACAATTGCALIVRQYFTEGFYPSGAKNPADAFVPSAALLKAVILAGARKLPASDGGSGSPLGVFPNSEQGWGFADLDGSLHFAGEKKKLFIIDDRTGVSTGQTNYHVFQVKDAVHPLKIILCWTDYPASAGANAALVNDLNLTVIAPSGKTYAGNAFSGFEPAYTPENSANSHVDNAEGVLLPDAGHGLECGAYTIAVEGYNVPFGPQEYAVAAVGAFDCVGGLDDVTPPSMLACSPADAAENVSISSQIIMNFSEAMHWPGIENAFSIVPPAAGNFEIVNSSCVIFAPSAGIAFNTVYTVLVNSSLSDRGENPLSPDAAFSFTTEPPPPNNPPNVPLGIAGPHNLYNGHEGIFYTAATDPDNNYVRYFFEWGDGENSTTAFYPAGDNVSAAHIWALPGEYAVKAKAVDDEFAESGWSADFTVFVEAEPPLKKPRGGCAYSEGEVPGIFDLIFAFAVLCCIAHRVVRRRRLTG
jgi:hypothetical protein